MHMIFPLPDGRCPPHAQCESTRSKQIYLVFKAKPSIPKAVPLPVKKHTKQNWIQLGDLSDHTPALTTGLRLTKTNGGYFWHSPRSSGTVSTASTSMARHMDAMLMKPFSLFDT